ncbi:MAG: hypothetical protein QOG73_476 [Acetobacteraceae bacterium]|jgi:hypothetical protein|nr:hypothetical protein [Acetobacteraceae bacterium]
MKTTLILSAAVLALAAQPCLARPLGQFGANSSFATTTPGAGQTIFALHGPAVTTGRIGNMQTTTLPGSGGVGYLMNNGNGTSTLTGPGVFSTVPTPR